MTDEQTLHDRAAILRTVRRYSQGVDQRDWELYARAFTEDGQVAVPGYLEVPLHHRAFAEFLGGTFDARRLSGQHILGNTLYDLHGHRARAVTEFLALTTERPDAHRDEVVAQRSAGLYVDDLVRVEDDWRIRSRTLVRKSDNRRTVHYSERTFDLVRGAARSDAVANL